MYDYFISYHSPDHKEAQEIHDGLVATGLSVFLDKEEIRTGDPVMETIKRNIEESKGILFLLGRNGLGKWQQSELFLALSGAVIRQKRMCTVLLPGVELDDIPPALEVLRDYSISRIQGPVDVDAVEQLYVELLGRRPPPREPAAPPLPGQYPQPVREALERLCPAARATPLTLYLGERLTHDETRYTPNSYGISRMLFREMKLIDRKYNQFLPTADVAGMYYTAQNSALGLVQAVGAYTAESTLGLPDTYCDVARMLRELMLLPGPPRGPNGPLALVMTTNLDLGMERALMMERVPFTRIVQDAGRPDGVAWHITRLDEDAARALPPAPVSQAPARWAEYLPRLDDAFALLDTRVVNSRGRKATLNARERNGLVLYKYHGSQDIPATCTISTDQYIHSIQHSDVPTEVHTTVAETPALFLGYRLLDPPFRHLYGTLLRAAFRSSLADHPKVMVCCPPPGEQSAYDRMEAKNWEMTRRSAVNASITAIQEWPSRFLDALLGSLRVLR